jgi:hypothetical protein
LDRVVSKNSFFPSVDLKGELPPAFGLPWPANEVDANAPTNSADVANTIPIRNPVFMIFSRFAR